MNIGPCKDKYYIRHFLISMIFLKLELFQKRLQLIDNSLHTVQGTNLIIPLVEIGEVRWD